MQVDKNQNVVITEDEESDERNEDNSEDTGVV